MVYDPAKDKKEQDDEKANGTKDEEGNAKDWNAEDLLEQHVFYVHRRIPRIVCFVLWYYGKENVQGANIFWVIFFMNAFC